MKTIEINIYSFEELSEQAQQKAIDQMREKYYEHNDFGHWAVDDCSLFEPPHEELSKLAAEDNRQYEFPMIENTRKNIRFSTDRNWYLDCAEAMHITDESLFLDWLGISENLRNDEDFYWKIYTPSYGNADTKLEIECSHENANWYEDEISAAIEKFSSHINDCLVNIQNDIEYRYTNEAIEEDIKANAIEFTEDGTIY
jgi:hypothetical protein